jgi:hypothetical protein
MSRHQWRKAEKAFAVSGCPACKKRINTMVQFLDHLTQDVMPGLIDRLSSTETSK